MKGLVHFPCKEATRSQECHLFPINQCLAHQPLRVLLQKSFVFFSFFSLFVRDIVAKGNDAYNVYLLLRALVDIVLAPQVCSRAAAQLQVLDDFYTAFRETFSNVKCIPKMHYMIHYPRLLVLYGPLCRLSCMRFEAKHQFFKSIARKTRNFKNICGTLSRRHLMKLMYSLTQLLESVAARHSKNRRKLVARSLERQTAGA